MRALRKLKTTFKVSASLINSSLPKLYRLLSHLAFYENPIELILDFFLLLFILQLLNSEGPVRAPCGIPFCSLSLMAIIANYLQ